MPRTPLHALRWSSDQGFYELSTQGQVVRRFRPGDEAAWQTWLGEVSSLAFHSPAGSLNVYQEARPRGGQYWYAYHTSRGRTRKRYLGRTAQVSLARLEETAQALSRAPEQTRSAAVTSPVPALPETDLEQLLLVTKLAPPQLPKRPLERTRLLRALDEAFAYPLTLLSASAGWGKTTLLASWASQDPHQIAWLSLDALDNELTRFWTALIAALRRCRPGMGALALAMVRSPQPPPVSAILTTLLNDLAQGAEHATPLLLLLDDYHLINDPAIQESVTFWVEHLPAQVHLLLASRVDPDLPLSRWRVRGQVLELRAADLGFRLEEASAFLQQTMGLALAEAEVAALLRRTEGWVAGLQLAALSLRQQKDPSAWVATLTGSQRYLLDYVQEEILQQQPLPLQRFLLQVAVLTRMSAALCQAVTGEPASQELLEMLERSNLFVVPLDEQRQWYRLHDLFREALLARLQASQPDLLTVLHLRAARWYEGTGELREAIVHALAARNFPYAAHLLEHAAPTLWQRGEAQTVLTWVHQLPDPIFRQHLRLIEEAALHLLQGLHETVSGFYARTLSQVEQTLSRVEAVLLQAAAASVGPEISEPPSVLEDAEVIGLQRRLRLLRVLIAARGLLRRSDADAIEYLAQEIAGLAEQEELSWQMVAFALTFWHTESLQREGAFLIPRLLEIKARVLQAGDALDGVRAREWLAFAYLRAGRLRLAEQECLEGLALVEQTGVSTAFEGYLHSHLAITLYAWNRLDEAARAVQRVLAIARAWQQADLLIGGELHAARLALARGDLAAADQALRPAETLVQHERMPHVASEVAALRVQYWLAEGELELAHHWAEQASFSPDNLTPNDTWAVLALVQGQLARQQSQEALQTLERFRQQLDRPGDIYLTVRFLALSVVALYQAGRHEHAQTVLARLLALTAPEGDLRVYLDQGAPMQQALLAWLTPAREPSEPTQQVLRPFRAFVNTLLAAFEQEGHGASRSQHVATTPESVPSLVQQPVPVSSTPGASLTRREQEVLRLLAEGASNQEIAQTLVISLETVKKHVSNLLGKLGATSRTQAIALARARSLL